MLLLHHVHCIYYLQLTVNSAFDQASILRDLPPHLSHAAAGNGRVQLFAHLTASTDTILSVLIARSSQASCVAMLLLLCGVLLVH
jgi:hypothetical protein